MHIERDIRTRIFYGDAVLVIELANEGGISIGLIRCMVFDFCTHSDVQVFESQASFIPNPVAGKDDRHIYRRIPDYLLIVTSACQSQRLPSLNGFCKAICRTLNNELSWFS